MTTLLSSSLASATPAAPNQAASQAADEVTDILNDNARTEANKSPKRRAQEGELGGEPPSKRPTTAVPSLKPPSVQHLSPRRQSPRLKRKSLILQAPPKNRSDWDVSGSDDEAEKARNRPREPPKKQRRLAKSRDPDPSPFKNKGVLETRSSRRVNLDDSPKKRKAPLNLAKIGQSIQKIAVRKPPPSTDTQAAGADVGDKEDALTDAPNSQAARQTPQKSKPIQSTANESPEQRVTRSATKKAKFTDDGQLSTGQANRPVLVDEEAEDDAGRGSEQEPAEVEEHSESYAMEPDIIDDPREKAKALAGIEEPARVHHCQEHWAELIVAAKHIKKATKAVERDEWDGVELQSIMGGSVMRYLKEVKKLYREMRQSQQQPPQELISALQPAISCLENRCKHLKKLGTENRGSPNKGERGKLLRHIYCYLIPEVILVMKQALQALYRDGALRLEARREISNLSRIADILVYTAVDWRPRPILGHRIRETVRKHVRPNLSSILEAYQTEIDEFDLQMRKEAWMADLTASQKSTVDELYATNARILAQNRERARQRNISYSLEPPFSSQPPASQLSVGRPANSATGSLIADIDDFDDEEPEGRANDRISPVEPSRSQISRPGHTRPRLAREQTEEIPPPVPIRISPAQHRQLLLGLQRYTSSTRYEDILDEMGGAGGALEGFDVDQLMALAKFCRQSCAKELKDSWGNDFDWLRSV